MASPVAGADIIAVLRFRRKQVLDSFETQREISGNHSFHSEIGVGLYYNFSFAPSKVLYLMPEILYY